MNIEPKNTETVKKAELEDYTGLESVKVAEQLTAKGLKVISTGDASKVEGQYPQAEETIVEGGTVILKTAGETALPDFTGWSKRDLLAFQSLSGISLEIVGEGYAASQSLTAGSAIKEGEPVVVQMLTPEESFQVQMTDGMEGNSKEESTDPAAFPETPPATDAVEGVEEQSVEEQPTEESSTEDSAQ